MAKKVIPPDMFLFFQLFMICLRAAPFNSKKTKPTFVKKDFVNNPTPCKIFIELNVQNEYLLSDVFHISHVNFDGQNVLFSNFGDRVDPSILFHTLNCYFSPTSRIKKIFSVTECTQAQFTSINSSDKIFKRVRNNNLIIENVSDLQKVFKIVLPEYDYKILSDYQPPTIPDTFKSSDDLKSFKLQLVSEMVKHNHATRITSKTLNSFAVKRQGAQYLRNIVKNCTKIIAEPEKNKQKNISVAFDIIWWLSTYLNVPLLCTNEHGHNLIIDLLSFQEIRLHYGSIICEYFFPICLNTNGRLVLEDLIYFFSSQNYENSQFKTPQNTSYQRIKDIQLDNSPQKNTGNEPNSLSREKDLSTSAGTTKKRVTFAENVNQSKDKQRLAQEKSKALNNLGASKTDHPEQNLQTTPSTYTFSNQRDFYNQILDEFDNYFLPLIVNKSSTTLISKLAHTNFLSLLPTELLTLSKCLHATNTLSHLVYKDTMYALLPVINMCFDKLLNLPYFHKIVTSCFSNIYYHDTDSLEILMSRILSLNVKQRKKFVDPIREFLLTNYRENDFRYATKQQYLRWADGHDD